MDNRENRNDNTYYTEYDNMNGNSYSNNGGYNSNGYSNGNYNTGNYYSGKTYDSAEMQSKIMTKSFLIVLAALMVTAVTATFVVYNDALANAVFSSFPIFLVAEFVVVIGATVAISKRKTGLATGLFAIYAIINGLTLSVIFYAYDIGSIQEVLLLTAGMFAGMALIGATTHINLTKVGSFLLMALWGVILVSVVNVFFLHSTGLNLMIDYVGVLIFVVLTAYDTQKMKAMARSGEMSDANIISLYCGMQLYLDFINLFLRLLRIFGRSRN